MTEFQPSARTEEDPPTGAALSRCIRLVEGSLPRFEMCVGILDTRWYAQLRIPSSSYGAGRLDVSHGPRRFIDKAKLQGCASVYALFAQETLA